VYRRENIFIETTLDIFAKKKLGSKKSSSFNLDPFIYGYPVLCSVLGEGSWLLQKKATHD